MRFIETTKLAEFIDEFRELVEEGSVRGIYERVRSSDIVSLQKASLLGDSDYLKEVASVINVIVSIIYHPHLANRREEVIMRVEQAGHLGNEEFREVLRDSKLWKQHGKDMIPEEVHYHQHIDELRIYENRFIVMLVDMLGREMEKYSTFYLSKLPTLKTNATRLTGGEIGKILMMVDSISRKIRFIKGTYFYREISKEKALVGRIRPTNILTKDRLYRRCYRFYLDFVAYDDVMRLKSDMRTYFVFHVLKVLAASKFRIDFDSTQGDQIPAVHPSGFNVYVGLPFDDAVSLDVDFKGEGRVSHLLRFVTGDEQTAAVGGYATEEALSLWRLFSIDGGGVSENASEEELVRRWLSSKVQLAAIDKAIYEKYCPICRRRAVDRHDAFCVCRECGSEYLFVQGTRKDTAWFRIIRK